MWLFESKVYRYLPAFLVILDTVIITQLNRRFSNLPNLIREVTTLRWDVWVQIKYDFIESATETVENSTSIQHLI